MKARELLDVEIDLDGTMFELEKDEHDGPKRLGGGVLSSSRRGVIHLLFSSIFSSPPEHSWKRTGGVAALIRHRLNIPDDSNRMVIKVICDIAGCAERGLAYDGSKIEPGRGRKTLVEAGSSDEGIVG